MNQERPNEKRASRVVERLARVSLHHHDTLGGVDYMSADGTVALEVTRVTERERIEARDAIRRAKPKIAGLERLQTCWKVTFPDTQPGLGQAVQRILPSLLLLEARGDTRFEKYQGLVQLRQEPELEGVFGALLDAGVETAWALPAHNHNSTEHRVIASQLSGGGVGGVNDALQYLERVLESAQDNFTKLRDSAALSRHLFVWVDDDSDYVVTRALSRVGLGGPSDELSVPSRAPEIDESVSDLWIMNEVSGLGWKWSAGEWTFIQMTEYERTSQTASQTPQNGHRPGDGNAARLTR